MQIKSDVSHTIDQLDKFKEEFGAIGHGGFGKQVISAAEKAVESLQAFNGSLSALDGLAKFFEKAGGTTRGAKAGGTRAKSPCLKCVDDGKPVPPNMGLGGRVGRFCALHLSISQTEKDKLKKKAA